MFNNRQSDEIAAIRSKIAKLDEIIEEYEKNHPITASDLQGYPEHEEYKALKKQRKVLTMQRQNLLVEQHFKPQQPMAPSEDHKSSEIAPR